MKKNIGTFKEEEMVISLNDRSFKDLSNNLKEMVMQIYGHMEADFQIHSGLVDGFMKPDFYISVNQEVHYISMKSGTSDSVHQDQIKPFCLYLRSLGISNRTLQTILLYQYGDGTLDGSGKERMPYERLRYLLAGRMKEANQELNENKERVLMIVNRLLFTGNNPKYVEADYIYHGDRDYGIIVSKKQVLEHVKRKNWGFYECLHIGPILFRPHARYVNKAVFKEKSRHKMEFYWPKLEASLNLISKRYNG